ncbi:DUF3060 domain-containing protein [Chryseobacterium sp. L7]|uniref:DUF3060 domain-containing protein n=1 Tax=Chryseobacterium endalhagicum TaxID=2797638 RepID=A0ABS1QE46_9FLAO|nr:DUF3060 domain-containing protein [Chryseobacterium endalhagicum]MBL1220874.1 DUF3060 domain-containing protein [Chryseobacterium endalhagicum]
MKKTLAFFIVLVGINAAYAQTTTKTTSTHGESKQTGKNIEVDGVGNKQTYSSDGGNASVEGVNNVITITGYVNKLEVAGSGNTVYVDKVSRIELEGTTNKVFYKTSPTKSGKAEISSTGVGNSAVKK